MKKLIPCVCILLILALYVSALPPLTSIVQLFPHGNDEYFLEFVNRQDTIYRFSYITNEGGTFKYGDNDKDLVFIEGNFSESMTAEALQQTNNVFNIGILDYFVLSNSSDSSGDDEHALTHIIRYNSIDIYDRRLSFDVDGSGTQEFIYESLNPSNGAFIGKAHLRFGNTAYFAYIGNVTAAGNDNPLVIDMNGDGIINRAEIRATTIKGNILDFGNASESDGGQYTYSLGSGSQTWSNSGDTIISNDTVDFTFLTKRRTIGHLPVINQPVITHIQVRENDTLNITSVEGRTFTLLPPDDHRLTPYRFFFKLSTDIEGQQLEISFRNRH